MDRVFTIDERAKDDIITAWMHTYSADLTMSGSTSVTLKMIVNNESFDFHQVNYFTCKQCNAIDKCLTSIIDIKLYFIANQGIPRNINTREHLDNWHHAGVIYSRILFSFLPRRKYNIG